MARETYEWANLWWEHAEDFDSPRIIVIGDSITNGYRGQLQQKLNGLGVMVDLYAGSRSVEDEAYFKETEYVLGVHHGYNYKVIQLNNGIHGDHITADDYEKGYRRELELVKSLHPEAVLALATSTIYTPKGMEGKIDEERNRFILDRNEIVRRLADEYKLPLNDLFRVTSGHAEYAQPDTVHFTFEGYDALSTATAEFVKKYLA